MIVIHIMRNNKLDRLEKQLQELKQRMNEIGLMRPGSLSRQTRKAKDTYGAYWHLSYTHRGKGHTHYVRDEWAGKIREEIDNYRLFKKLLDRYLDLAIERSREWLNEMKRTASNQTRTRVS